MLIDPMVHLDSNSAIIRASLSALVSVWLLINKITPNNYITLTDKKIIKGDTLLMADMITDNSVQRHKTGKYHITG